jgi:hypothetical protein
LPSLNEHQVFDVILKWESVIKDETETYKIHRFIDSKIPGHHRSLDDKMTIEMVRKWISKFSHLGYPETFTDYVRVAFGHLILDEVWDKYRQEPMIVVLRKAFSLFKRRGYDRKKYSPKCS